MRNSTRFMFAALLLSTTATCDPRGNALDDPVPFPDAGAPPRGSASADATISPGPGAIDAPNVADPDAGAGGSNADPDAIPGATPETDAAPMTAPDGPASRAPTDARSPDAAPPPPACMNACQMGQRRCPQNRLEECTIAPGGCLAWTPVSCPIPANASTACDGTNCGFRCNPGFNKCDDQCRQNSDASCGSACAPCQSPMTCQGNGGGARCSCPNICEPGSKQCGPGGGVQDCVRRDNCPAWGNERPCTVPNGTAVCMAGACAVVSCQGGRNLCDNRCVEPDDVTACGPGCMPCRTTVPNASPVCSAGQCEATCNAGALTCSAAPLRCEQARWPFESTLDGFTTTVEDGFTGAAAVLSAGQAHGGSRALAVGNVISQSGGSFAPFVGVEKGICGDRLDPRGKKVIAFVFFDGPDISQTAPDNGLSTIPSCAIVFKGGGRVFGSDMPSGLGTTYTRLSARRWLTVSGFFPNVDNITPWLSNPISIQVFCNPIGAEGTIWQGTMYVDDMRLD
jgi:hypothetical protein